MKMIKTQNKKQKKKRLKSKRTLKIAFFTLNSPRGVNKLQTLERYGENLDGKRLSVEHWQVMGTFQFWNRFLI